MKRAIAPHIESPVQFQQVEQSPSLGSLTPLFHLCCSFLGLVVNDILTVHLCTKARISHCRRRTFGSLTTHQAGFYSQMCGGKDWVVLPLSRCTCMHSGSFHSSDLELAKSFRTPRTTFGVKIRSMVVSTKMRILWVNKMWFFSQNTKDFNV